jgi:hypothetical protein
MMEHNRQKDKPGVKSDFTDDEYLEIADRFRESGLGNAAFLARAPMYRKEIITEHHLRRAIRKAKDYGRWFCS